ncbi:hypothetical protein BDW66DRAFT_161498 [Aspergillus desertorum]
MEPLSPADFCIYNRLAEKMKYIHNGFRATWTELKAACSPSLTPSQFPTPSPTRNHHSIEERYVFPLLAERMPEFATGGVLTAQHEVIHDGLVRLGAYLRGCERYSDGEEGGWRLDRGALRALLEGEDGEFERVLWEHLDWEVELLRPERLRSVLGVEEVRRFEL